MAGVPDLVSRAIMNSMNAIDERGELPNDSRKRLYESIVETSKNDDKLANLVRIEIKCARKNIKNLTEFGSEYILAKKILELSEGFLKSRKDKENLQKMSNDLYTELEDLMDKGEHTFPAAYAGFACFSAANSAMYGLDLAAIGVPEIETDPDDWTACFYSCLSQCGGATWENENGNDKERRKYWEWFLNHAVPDVWTVDR